MSGGKLKFQSFGIFRRAQARLMLMMLTLRGRQSCGQNPSAGFQCKARPGSRMRVLYKEDCCDAQADESLGFRV